MLFFLCKTLHILHFVLLDWCRFECLYPGAFVCIVFNLIRVIFSKLWYEYVDHIKWLYMPQLKPTVLCQVLFCIWAAQKTFSHFQKIWTCIKCMMLFGHSAGISSRGCIAWLHQAVIESDKLCIALFMWFYQNNNNTFTPAVGVDTRFVHTALSTHWRNGFDDWMALLLLLMW